MIKASECLVQKLAVNTLGFIITFIWEFIRIVVKNVAEYFKVLMELRKHTVQTAPCVLRGNEMWDRNKYKVW
jgi:hypothetical protein